jgi:hypothetical protein
VHDDFLDDTIITGAHPGGSNAPSSPDFENTILVGAGSSSGAIPPERGEAAVGAAGSAGRLADSADGLSSALSDDASLRYHLRIGATVIGLDKVAFIGRKPVAPRVLLEGVPRLIAVSSPLREVSGTHLEVRQRGANVVLTDLRSANGSVVNIPGRAPRKLCRGESLVVTAGTLVDIGDGNLVEILPMQRV